MRLSPRLLVVSGITAIAAVLAAGAWMAVLEPWEQRQRLPDGTILRLEGVTHGTHHEFDPDPWWRAVLYRQGPVYERLTRQERTLFWISETEKRKGARAHRSYYTAPIDEHGCRFPRSTGGMMNGAARRPHSLPLLAKELPLVNRRSDLVSLAFFDQTARQPVAVFHAANPASGSYPTWEPEPYPITKRRARLEFTLRSLEHRPIRVDRGTAAVLEVAEDGQRTDRWSPRSVMVSDATGNRVRTDLSYSSRDGKTWFDGLCARESAWQVKVEFAPSYPVRVPPDFTWTIEDLHLNGGPGRAKGALSAKRGGVDLRVVGSSRPADWPPSRPDPERRVSVTVRAAARTGGYLLTLTRVTDQRGWDLTSSAQGGGFEWISGGASQLVRPGQDDYSFSLRPPLDARVLDLTFSLHRTQTAEFLARP